MKIIVIRHGETEENAKHILMGHKHGTLSKKGIAQAKKLALKLRKTKIDAIFSSDLRRARDTTKEIARYHKAPVFYTKELREQNYGIFQGRLLQELIDAQKAAGKASLAFKPSGGEGFVDVRNRVRKFVGRLGKKYEKKTILISAHAGIVWSLLSIYSNVPLGKLVKMKPKNTGTLTIDIANKKLVVIRDDMFD